MVPDVARNYADEQYSTLWMQDLSQYLCNQRLMSILETTVPTMRVPSRCYRRVVCHQAPFWARSRRLPNSQTASVIFGAGPRRGTARADEHGRRQVPSPAALLP